MFDSKNVSLGIAPIGWCNDDMPELGAENTFQQIVSEMALAGFTGCEIGNKYPSDPAELKKALEARGVTVLSNEFLALERNGDTAVLAGIDDPNGYADQKSPEAVAEEVRAAYGENAFWMLLAHRNDHFPEQYSLLGADLVLSGHGHGGLIRLPFTDGLVSTDRSLFPSYTAGFYEANGGEVFVSRGLGNSGPSFRLFNRPEVAVLTLRTQ